MQKGNLKRERVVTDVNVMNDILKTCEDIGLNKYYWSYKDTNIDPRCNKQSGYKSMSIDYIIHETLTVLEVTTSYYGDEQRPTTYRFSMNQEDIEPVSGQKTFMEFSKYYKIPDLSKHDDFKRCLNFDSFQGKFYASCKALLGCKHKGKKVYKDCYEYDLNSAYSACCLGMIPDLSECETCRDVQEGEVGFVLTDELTLVDEGYADYIFKLIPCPKELREYIFNWYNIKKTTTDATEKRKAKMYLNAPIGYAQRKNPFFRAYVIGRCNNFIYSLLEAYPSIFMWNTDAVFSTEPLDLDIGTEIGMFKEIKIKELKCDGLTYQADDDIPVFRGIPKKWFKAFEFEHNRPFNLLTDTVPQRCNLYNYNDITNRLEIAEWAKEK